MKKIILASTSRWRKELLGKLGVSFTIVASDYPEDMTLPLSPANMAKRFALGKARVVAKRHPKAVVIGADTVLVFRGKVLGKPKSKREAMAMLQRWSGNRGHAITAFAVIAGKKEVVRVVKTDLHFRKLSSREIARYVASGEAETGAGSFTILGKAASFIERIDGDFYNIVGLPLASLAATLKRFGVAL